MKFPRATYGVISRYEETNSSNKKKALHICPVQTRKAVRIWSTIESLDFFLPQTQKGKHPV